MGSARPIGRALVRLGSVYVVALVSYGQRLTSSSVDKKVKVWSMATWACLQTVQVYLARSVQYIGCLAVSGPTLVGGSRNDEDEEYAVYLLY